MEWESVGDNGLFEKKMEPVIVGQKIVAHVGYLKLKKEMQGLPQEEMHFYSADKKTRTGFVSVIGEKTAIIKLANGDELTARSSLIEPVNFARALAEKPGVSVTGMLFGHTLLKHGNEESYASATVEELNAGFIMRPKSTAAERAKESKTPKKHEGR